jgi:hypothetical protein
MTVVVIVVLSIIDNVDIPDIDVVVGELVCCIVVVVLVVVGIGVGIGVGGHVRGAQLIMQLDSAVVQSCWVDVKCQLSIPITNHLNVDDGSPGN